MKLIYTGDFDKLKELGFEKHPLVYVKNNIRNSCNLQENKKIYIDEKSRVISIGTGLFNTDIELETIYDLIQAGLVKKEEK